ncbi:mannitol dehydrogenase family protein [Brevundimonas subvibrioides]|uniref:Mannitol dehydrogenase domain protein n=1 Tax=Brevundimonas subvibrioides (strain ATCC 15264 / DSM 4735 / LMG 14903 / NBRC 16000 / CB 81) TaxID=633149 RepID=D9QH29_BRESC|nr:mannitol dehydrogenase family protein [Brevundimonas subvibrioides]ADL00995.1 Mannitol dehydrogenase domain protein [Brevundimonas subvibrioides ATCC 15264]
MTGRLSNATLAGLTAQVERPGYDRSSVRIGVVHLGIGAFHRAHQAVVFDDALRSGDMRWGILGVSLRSPGVRDQLQPQDGLYSVLVRDGDVERIRIIGAVQGVLVAPEDPGAVVEAMASRQVHIVTLTVTEKGYRLDPASGSLIETDPDVVADIANPVAPRTAPGFLVAALARRRQRGLPPFTVVSCDNLPHNGARVRSAVLGMAGRIDPALADWIAEAGAFPATMVDRIVPATTPDDVASLAARLGVEDPGMVKTEPFTQWVIEDRFCGPRPDFAALGVQLTDAVAPWEDAKLRLLNGAHSAIAYLGGLAGHAFVHQVVAEPPFAAFVERLWDEAATTLSPPPGLDVAAYRRDLMARFRNPALQHRTRQIAMDGSQKLPQRLLATIADRLAAGQGIEALAMAVAGWIRWQDGVAETGETHVVDDPLADVLGQALAGTGSAADRVRAIAGLSAVVPSRLGGDVRFITAVGDALAGLESRGVVATLG